MAICHQDVQAFNERLANGDIERKEEDGKIWYYLCSKEQAQVHYTYTNHIRSSLAQLMSMHVCIMQGHNQATVLSKRAEKEGEVKDEQAWIAIEARMINESNHWTKIRSIAGSAGGSNGKGVDDEAAINTTTTIVHNKCW